MNLIRKNILLFIFIAILPTIGLSQNLSDETVKHFIEALISQSDDLHSFVDTTELHLSQRLGISYIDSKNKFLISNDLDFSLKQKLIKGDTKYRYHIKKLKENYSQLLFEVPKENIELEYIFKNSKLISKPYYYS